MSPAASDLASVHEEQLPAGADMFAAATVVAAGVLAASAAERPGRVVRPATQCYNAIRA